MMKTREFITLYIMNFFSIFFGLFVANEYKVYWLQYGNAPGDKFVSMIGSLGTLFNGMRFIWSTLLDYYPYKIVYGVMLTMEIILGFTFPFVVTNNIVYPIYICLGFLCLGGHFTLVPNECKRIFGPKTTELYSYLYSYAGITGVTECVLQICVMNANNLRDFFFLYSGLACISLFMLIFVYKGNVYYHTDKT